MDALSAVTTSLSVMLAIQLTTADGGTRTQHPGKMLYTQSHLLNRGWDINTVQAFPLTQMPVVTQVLSQGTRLWL